MLVTHDREKLINAIHFFSANTKYCGVTKLFKLLYFLDFEHFKVTGRSVTGLTYFAWPMGPVPRDLKNELDGEFQSDLSAKVRIEEVQLKNGKTLKRIIPVSKFDPDLFSKRELAIMNALVSQCNTLKADDMIEATHLENKPWDRVYNQEHRRQEVIPYEYAIRADEAEFMKYVTQENNEILSNYKNR